MQSISNPFRILTLALGTALILAFLFQNGMFMDGLIYAAVSNNLAMGLGDYWNLTFSTTFLKDYSEQLPLFFWIQSVFFQVFGSDNIYPERIFLFFTVVLTAFNISQIWKLWHRENPSMVALEWFPILLWLITPVCFWSYVNNVQETLMAVFATSAVFFVLKGLRCPTGRTLHYLVAGFFIFCCSFCKGPQGLFPLVTIVLYSLITRKITFKKSMALSCLITAVPVAIYGLILWYPESAECVAANFNNRMVRTFTQAGSSTTNSRFYLLFRLFTELLPAIGIAVIITIIQRIKKYPVQNEKAFSSFLFFLTLGLSGIVPLIVTSEQRGFYMVTALPFVALAIAQWVSPLLLTLLQKINPGSPRFQWFKRLSFILLVVSITFAVTQVGKTKRDRDKIGDVHIVGTHIGKNSTVSVVYNLRHDYSLVAYFSRFQNISLDLNPEAQHSYVLRKKGSPEKVKEGYQKVDLPLKRLELFEKTESY